MSKDHNGTVGILDFEVPGERSLADSAVAAEVEHVVVRDLDELADALSERRVLVALIAFEALWPEPQRKLRKLRAQAPWCRLMVAHSARAPRQRLGQRLWSAGLTDLFLPRSTRPDELAPVLVQARADAAFEADEQIRRSEDEPTSFAALQFATRLGGTLVNQTSVSGLSRELQRRLHGFIDCLLFQFVLIDHDRSRQVLHSFQTQAIDPKRFAELTDELCEVASIYLDEPISAGDLHWEGTPPPTDEIAGVPDELHSAVWPMVQCGNLVGCVAVLVRDELTPTQQAVMQLLSHQLTSVVRSLQVEASAEEAALIDELTGAFNRRYLARTLSAEWQRARRYKLKFSVAMLDVDHFKQFNDSYGHATGDHVLRIVTDLISQHLRETDHIIRYGGEEFALLLPETAVSEAALVVERLRVLMAKQTVYFDEAAGNVTVTFSAGVAAIPECKVGSADELLDLADQALLVAKRTGRNRVCVAGQSGAVSEVIDDERRRFPRLPSNLKVQYVPLPDFEPRSVTLMGRDQTPDGLGVMVSDSVIKPSSYALVCLENAEAPRLSKVVWTRQESGLTHAGIRFLPSNEIRFGNVSEPEQPRALVAISAPQTMTVLQRVLYASGYEGDFITSESDLFERDLLSYAVVVIGDSPLRAPIVERLGPLGDAAPRLIFVNERGDRFKALAEFSTLQLEHLVGDPTWEHALFATLHKLVAGEYFGLNKYLMWGVEPRTWTLTSLDQKASVLEGILDLANEIRCHPRVAELLITAVDEMILNALTHTRPGSNVPVVVEAGSDGRVLGVAVLDSHGLLRPKDVYANLNAALSYQDSGFPIDERESGLGFWIMLNTLSQLAINVEPGRRTEIIGIIDLRKTLRDLRRHVPAIGMFTQRLAKISEG